MGDVERGSVVVGQPVDLDVVLNEHAVVQHRDPRPVDDLSLLVEFRGVEDDVVRLPLAGLARSIHQRRVLLVDRAGLTVVVSLILIRVEDLHLVALHQEYAAVAAFLAFAFHDRRRRPFDVQLRVAEFVGGDHVPSSWHHLDITVTHDPLCGTTLSRSPVRKVPAVEQHDCVRRRIGVGNSGRDDRRRSLRRWKWRGLLADRWAGRDAERDARSGPVDAIGHADARSVCNAIAFRQPNAIVGHCTWHHSG